LCQKLSFSLNNRSCLYYDVSLLLCYITIYRAFEVSALIFSPIVGSLLEKLGRKNAALIGFVIVVVATACMGLTAIIENEQVFLYTSIFIRFIQGMGDMWI
jgi:MFS family permease